MRDGQRDAAPVGRVGGADGVGDREEAEHRFGVRGGQPQRVVQAAHRVHLGDRLGGLRGEPGSQQRGGGDRGGEGLVQSQRLHLGVLGQHAERDGEGVVVTEEEDPGVVVPQAAGAEAAVEGTGRARAERTVVAGVVGDLGALRDLDRRRDAELLQPVGGLRAAAGGVDHQVGGDGPAVLGGHPGHPARAGAGGAEHQAAHRLAALEGDARAAQRLLAQDQLEGGAAAAEHPQLGVLGLRGAVGQGGRHRPAQLDLPGAGRHQRGVHAGQPVAQQVGAQRAEGVRLVQLRHGRAAPVLVRLLDGVRRLVAVALQDPDVVSEVREGEGGHQAGDASSDDQCLWHDLTWRSWRKRGRGRRRTGRTRGSPAWSRP